MDSGISPIPNMFEYESIPSQNAHKSMIRPRPLKYGLETEFKTESESRVLNTGSSICLSILYVVSIQISVY